MARIYVIAKAGLEYIPFMEPMVKLVIATRFCALTLDSSLVARSPAEAFTTEVTARKDDTSWLPI